MGSLVLKNIRNFTISGSRHTARLSRTLRNQVIDWGYPSGADKYLRLDDYVNGYINSAVDKIRERSGLDKITLLGVCQGGTFSVMYAAIHPENIKNLVTLVAPVNFDTDKGILNLWAKGPD